MLETVWGYYEQMWEQVKDGLAALSVRIFTL